MTDYCETYCLLTLHICVCVWSTFFVCLCIIVLPSIVDQYPAACLRECRCHLNPHERVLVVDCAHAGLTKIPKSLPKDTGWLILSGNNISSIKYVDLQFVPDLSRLDLHNNRIKYISEDFVEYLSTFSNLENLDISNNELKFIPRTLESANFLKAFMISGNRFECQCSDMWMKKWLIDSREMIQDYNEVDCQKEYGKKDSFY